MNSKGIDTVVLCGGHTDPARPGTSEAGTIRDYLTPLLEGGVKVLLEQQSITTAQNIKFSKRLVDVKSGNRITIFCDNIRPPKVMWFVLHYWFGLDRKEIEEYFIRYSLTFYIRHLTTERIGAEMAKGISYRNVTIKPYRMRTRVEDAVGNQIPSILEINSLYDRELDRRLIRIIKIKFGLMDVEEGLAGIEGSMARRTKVLKKELGIR